MTPLLPSHSSGSRRLTLGWLASTATAAVMVSGLTAWAMVSQEGANSIGDMEVAITLMVPEVPALEALTEPSPDVADAAPVEEAEPEPIVEETPDAPELTEAPDVPELSTPEQILAEDVPQVESEVPAPVVEKKPEPKPEPKPERKKERKQAEDKPKKEPKKRAEKKTEQQTASAKASQSAPAAKSSGGASAKAIANYGASVMKKVNRTRKKSAGARGKVMVGFKVDGGGGLASVWVASSSGSPQLDQVALDHIRRSAPFPPPPDGVGRGFSFEFVGK